MKLTILLSRQQCEKEEQKLELILEERLEDVRVVRNLFQSNGRKTIGFWLSFNKEKGIQMFKKNTKRTE